MNDTSKEIEKLQFERMIELGPTRRIELACEMYMTARQSLFSSLANVSSDSERQRLFVEKMYGAEFSDQMYDQIDL